MEQRPDGDGWLAQEHQAEREISSEQRERRIGRGITRAAAILLIAGTLLTGVATANTAREIRYDRATSEMGQKMYAGSGASIETEPKGLSAMEGASAQALGLNSDEESSSERFMFRFPDGSVPYSIVESIVDDVDNQVVTENE